MSRSYAERLADFVEALRKLVAAAPVMHMDETRFRIGGKTQWLHIASTAALTFYRVCAGHGSLWTNVIGAVVHAPEHRHQLKTIIGTRNHCVDRYDADARLPD